MVKINDFLDWFKVKKDLGKIREEFPIIKEIGTRDDSVIAYSNFETAKWQKIYSLSFIALTVVLVIVTGFYAIQTHTLNEMTQEQFEMKSRPYIILEGFRDNEETSEYIDIIIKNHGETPGIITGLKIAHPSGDEELISPRKEIVMPNKEYYMGKLNRMKNYTANITLEYSGTMQLSGGIYSSTHEIVFDQYSKGEIGDISIK